MTSQPDKEAIETTTTTIGVNTNPDISPAVNHTEGEVNDSSDDGDDVSNALLAIDAALAKKALEPVLLDVGDMCSYTSHILVVSGRSDRQVDAIADGIVLELKQHQVRPLGVEGRGSGQWVLIDFGDLIVHVFHHPVREHYDIESLWINAQRIPINIPEEAKPRLEDSYTV